MSVGRNRRSSNAPESLYSLDGAAVVSPQIGAGFIVTVGVVAGNTNWYSQVTDLGTPRARTGVLALIHSPTTPNAQSGAEIEVEWAAAAAGPWFPAPTSATGDARESKVVAGGGDRSLISRGQPMSQFFRIRYRPAGNPSAADTVLAVNYGNIF